MKIRFNNVEIDFTKQRKTHETFQERSHREHQEFINDFHRESDAFHARMRNR